MTHTTKMLSLIPLAICLQACYNDTDQSKDNIIQENTPLSVERSENISMKNMAFESYAKEYEVTLEEAEKRLHVMESANDIYQKLIDNFGEDNISSAFFDNGKNFAVG